MTRSRTARSLANMMQGVRAFETGNAPAALNAMRAARDAAEAATPGLCAAIDDAIDAVRRGERKALLTAMARAAAVAEMPPERPFGRADRKAAHPSPPTAGGRALAGVKPLPPLPRAMILLGEAEHASRRGDLPAARDALELVFELSETDPQASDLPTGERFSRVGAFLAEAGAWEPAARALNVALAVKTRLLGKSHRRIAPDLTWLSAAAEANGDYEAAIRFAERDLTIRRLQSNGAPADLAASLAHYGRAALGLEAYAEAAPALREALAIAQDIRADDLRIAALSDDLGLATARLEGWAAARPLLQRALALRRSKLPSNHPDIGRSLLHLAEAALEAHDFARAETHWRAALEHFEAPKAPPATRALAAQCHEGLAVIHLRRQNLPAAQAALLTALETLRAACGPTHPAILKLETERAFLLLAAGEHAAAADLAATLLPKTQAPRQDRLRRDLWTLFAQHAAARQQRHAAILFAKLAVNGFAAHQGALPPSAPQRLFDTGPGELFRLLAALLAKAQRLPEAAIALAMLKQDELFDRLSRQPAADPRHTTIALNTAESDWQAAGERIFKTIQENDETAGAPARLRDTPLRQKLRRWLDGADGGCAAAPPEARTPHAGIAALGARTALLQIIGAPQTLHLLLSTTEFQISREIDIPAPALATLAEQFRAAIAARAETCLAIGRQLHACLIAPITQTCRELGIKTLLLAPDGALRLIPFAALHDGERYLAQTMATCLFTEAAPDPAAPWAGPATMSAFATASHAAETANLIRAGRAAIGAFPGHLAVNTEFDRAALAEGLSSHRLIHLACPVTLQPGPATESTLTLGDGSQLPIAALASPPFHFRDVELVALTGCQTEMTGSAGAEIEALGALLRRRGAQSVLASLWHPKDGTPPKLLAEFYRQIRNGRPPSAALNTAQKSLLTTPNRLTHPYHWANLIVLGGVE